MGYRPLEVGNLGHSQKLTHRQSSPTMNKTWGGDTQGIESHDDLVTFKAVWHRRSYNSPPPHSTPSDPLRCRRCSGPHRTPTSHFQSKISIHHRINPSPRLPLLNRSSLEKYPHPTMRWDVRSHDCTGNNSLAISSSVAQRTQKI